MKDLISSLLVLLVGLTSVQTIDLIDSKDDPIPRSIREHWMRRAKRALSDLKDTPCPFGAFGAVIVNHTASMDGVEVCIGANGVREEGNPTLHGEIAAINNCTTTLTSGQGQYQLSALETLEAFSKLSLYTTAEACPMAHFPALIRGLNCATAMAQARFAEYIFATDIKTLKSLGWPQVDIPSREVFERSDKLNGSTRIIGGVLAEETDELFKWQWQDGGRCPRGCGRTADKDWCKVLKEGRDNHEEL